MKVKYSSSLEIKIPWNKKGEIIRNALKELLDDVTDVTPFENTINIEMKNGAIGKIMIVDTKDIPNVLVRIVVEHEDMNVVMEALKRLSEAITKAKEEVKEEEKKEENENEAEEESD